jgi:PAS domain-containing protein
MPKKKTESDTTSESAKKPTLGRTRSSLKNLTPTISESAPKNHLRPKVVLDEGKVIRVESSGRTPSPLGGRMGDHTVAWQVLLDALSASLFGLSLDDAIEELVELQEKVSKWMPTEDAPMLLLLRQTEWATTLATRLEDAAARFDSNWTDATTAEAVDAKCLALGQMIACHLAYLNYLPFATVPAESQRGSHGSGEGSLRKTLLTYEATESLKKPVLEEGDSDEEIPDESAEEDPTLVLSGALWGMFAIDAAIRESDIVYAIDKTSLDTVRKQVDALADLTEKFVNFTAQPEKVSRRAEPIKKTAKEISEAAEYEYIIKAAGYLRDLAGEAQQAVLGTRRDEKLNVIASKAQDASDLAAQVLSDLTTVSAKAKERAPSLLAYLLHKHQFYVARAYPRCVTKCGFLTDPQQAAADHLKSKLTELIPALAEENKEAQEALDGLLERFASAYDAWNDADEITIAVLPNEWAKNVGDSRSLVVTYDDKTRKLYVNGRAPAPTGVSGMGSHTTAWVVEVEALKSMVKTAKYPYEELWDRVRNDLKSPVMALDQYLPADQLDAGQLIDILDAAQAVEAATSVADRAERYLRFRNLLPFATVDAGNRAGQGERRNASEKDTFDDGSLYAATELQRVAYASNPKAAALSLEKAAIALQALAPEDPMAKKGRKKKSEPTVPPPEQRWTADAIRAAAWASIQRLREFASQLAGYSDINVVTVVSEVKLKAHAMTYLESGMPHEKK